MYELKKKLERYLRVNLLGPDPRLINKEFTGLRSRNGWETLFYDITQTWEAGVASKIQQDTILCSLSQKNCKGARVHSMTLYQLHISSERNDW